MNKNFTYRIVNLIVAMMLFACNEKRAETVASISSIKQPGETDQEVINRIEDELVFRNLTGDSSLMAADSIIVDSTLVISDTIHWIKHVRTISKSKSLHQFNTKSLESIYGQKVLYGRNDPDNRKDWYETDTRAQATSQQAVCFIEKSKLVKLPNGNYSFKSRPFYEAKYLCSTERFYEQPVTGFCSGFAISKDLIVTAGHCIDKKNLTDFVIVFDFKMVDKGVVKNEFAPGDIYSPIAIASTGLNQQGVDYAVLRVNRKIPKNRISFVREKKVRDGEPVFVIGHPCGLPLKVANTAKVIDNKNPLFFSADLDTYGGNSGSPVYDSAHQIVGILVRGATDFKYDFKNKCYNSQVCETILTPECGGEFVSRTNQFLQILKKSKK